MVYFELVVCMCVSIEPETEKFQDAISETPQGSMSSTQE